HIYIDIGTTTFIKRLPYIEQVVAQLAIFFTSPPFTSRRMVPMAATRGCKSGNSSNLRAVITRRYCKTSQEGDVFSVLCDKARNVNSTRWKFFQR
ncbi:MAG: hypothetical protein PV344_05260, partial [Anaplasma sp.]|nr:hypothetical protein [Anaplasma sp.]